MKNKKIAAFLLTAAFMASMSVQSFAVIYGPGFDDSNYQNQNVPNYTTQGNNGAPGYGNGNYYPGNNYPGNNYPGNNYPGNQNQYPGNNYPGNQYPNQYPNYHYPQNNPAYNTGWNQSGGPGYEGSNPMGDREQWLDDLYAGGPGSTGANQMLDQLQNGFYINSTQLGGTWEELPDGKWRLLDENGQPVSSKWAYVDGKTYVLDMYGIMQTGFQVINEKWYYFNSVGAMQTGWLLKNGKYYFLNTDGSMAYGWVNSEGKWYFMDLSTGAMLTNTRTPDGRYVNAEGVMI